MEEKLKIDEDIMLLMLLIKKTMHLITGFAEILTGKDCSNECKNHYSQQIILVVERLLKLMDDIILFDKVSNDDKVELNFFDLNKVFQKLFIIYSEDVAGKDLNFICKKACSFPDSLIYSNEKIVKMMLENLIDNALKHTITGTIEFGYELIDDHYLSIYVKDTGIGIKENEKKKIFDLFYRSPEAIEKNIEGIGIGLNIVSRLAKMMNIEISLTTEHGKGSCFRLKLKRNKMAQ